MQSISGDAKRIGVARDRPAMAEVDFHQLAEAHEDPAPFTRRRLANRRPA
jgi:hypothetical protein